MFSIFGLFLSFLVGGGGGGGFRARATFGVLAENSVVL